MFSPTVLLPPSPSHFTPPSSPRFSSPFGQHQQPPLASFSSPSSSSSSSRKRNRDESPFQNFQNHPQRKRVCDSQRFVLKGSRKRKRPGEDVGIIFVERPEMSVADLPLEVINPHKRVRATLPEQEHELNLPQPQIIEEPISLNNDERSVVLYHPNQDRSLVLYGQQNQRRRENHHPHPSDVNDRSLVPFVPPRYNSNVDYAAFAPRPSHLPQYYPNSATHDVVLYQSRGNEEETSQEEDSLMRDID